VVVLGIVFASERVLAVAAWRSGIRSGVCGVRGHGRGCDYSRVSVRAGDGTGI
jgi:hypothetical protein